MRHDTSGRHTCPRPSSTEDAHATRFASIGTTQPLPLLGECTIAAAIATARVEWDRRAVAGTMSAQTTAKAGDLTARFEAFAAAHDVFTLDAVDHTLVARFVGSRGRNRRGDTAPAAPATRRNRLATLRLFFSTARHLGLTVADPTRDVTVPPRTPTTRRAVTETEAEHLRFIAKPWSTTRHASTIALLLAGAHSAEVGHITVSDLHVENMQVRAHGATKFRPRWLDLGPWATDVLTRRAAHLRQHHPNSAERQVLCTGAGGTDAHKQARIGMTVREVLRSAGLDGDPTIQPSSLTAYAAAQEFARSGSIVSAANIIGSTSLDATARMVGLEWASTGRCTS